MPFLLALLAASQASPPQPIGPPNWISHMDYPPAALREGAQGTVRMRLAIDATGRVTECTILSSAGHTALDVAACRLIRSRARFQPARDSAGRAVEGFTESNIRWALPRPTPIPFVANRHVMTVSIVDGFARSCTLQSDLPHPPVVGGPRCPSETAPAPATFPRNGRVQAILVFEPEGAAPPRIESTAGTVFQARVRLQVDATGRVTACTADIDTGQRQAPPERLCQPFLNGSIVFEADPAGRASRAASIRSYVLTERSS